SARLTVGRAALLPLRERLIAASPGRWAYRARFTAALATLCGSSANPTAASRIRSLARRTIPNPHCTVRFNPLCIQRPHPPVPAFPGPRNSLETRTLARSRRAPVGARLLPFSRATKPRDTLGG